MARLDKVAGSVLWLISETSSYVTGVIISVNAAYSLIGARIIRSDVMKSHCYRARIELCSLFLAHIPGSWYFVRASELTNLQMKSYRLILKVTHTIALTFVTL